MVLSLLKQMWSGSDSVLDLFSPSGRMDAPMGPGTQPMGNTRALGAAAAAADFQIFRLELRSHISTGPPLVRARGLHAHHQPLRARRRALSLTAAASVLWRPCRHPRRRRAPSG